MISNTETVPSETTSAVLAVKKKQTNKKKNTPVSPATTSAI